MVLDASIAIPWVVREQSTPSLDQLFQQGYWGVMTYWVPGLWWWECGNVFDGMVRAGRLDDDGATDALRLLRYARPVTDPLPDAETLEQTLRLARTQNLTFYDAAYLELAERRRCPLATLDGALRAAAGRRGVLCLDL